MKNSRHTPWGYADDARDIAEGITRVSTPSHGGFILTEARMAEFNARLTIHFQPFAGYGYFEEDCDWSAVALAFPEYFTDQQLRDAIATVKGLADPSFCPSLPDIAQRWAGLAAWLTDTKQGREVSERAQEVAA